MDPADFLGLAAMSHSALLSLRASLAPDDPLHELLAPIEHRAFARESVSESPVMAASLGIAIPAYTGAKWLAQNTDLGRATLGQMDYFKDSSPASFQEMAQAFRGVGEGMATWQGQIAGAMGR